MPTPDELGTIERVAKALHGVDLNEFLMADQPWFSLPESGRDFYRTRARAAIEAAGEGEDAGDGE